ncbi:MAG: hypothetical protein LBS81_04175 [Endomicrobium sp.]|jgi:hypothetical protein|nr:hypothetical protein [Endomicrobium sp.]
MSKVKWVALRDINVYKKFETILRQLRIPHADFKENLDFRLDEILYELFN